jgi:hypothetical protein
MLVSLTTVKTEEQAGGWKKIPLVNLVLASHGVNTLVMGTGLNNL